MRPVPVLLVDDDEDDYLMTRDLLSEIEGSRFDLEWIPTFDASLDAIRREQHELYLLDYHLGERNGLELLCEAIRGGCRAPIILLTGQDDHELDMQAIRAGAADYLIKGRITADSLERSIRYAMERKKAQEALRESEERYALAVQGANDGLWDWNLKTNKIYYSPRWKSILGLRENEVGDSPEEWFKRVHPEDLGALKMQISLHLQRVVPHFENEHRMLHQDGGYRWVLSRGLAVHAPGDGAKRMAGSLTDITKRKATERQLLRHAFHDVLTGLPNRALFMDRLERAVARAKRDNGLFAVLFLDLDRFKVLNDSLGHLVGDQLLIALARRLEACLRSGDTVARLGGDEFVVLAGDLKAAQDANQLAERIQAQLAPPFDVSGHEIFTTASIGIALSTTGFERAEDLIRDADTAMYQAKSAGKARFEIFNTEMHHRAVALLHLETDLRRAVECREFRIQYQPIVALETGRIAGFEALLRWQHPSKGLVLPTEFIPVAEETGLIVPIGRWILCEACFQARAWQQQFPDSAVAISVNLSRKQFQQPDLLGQIDQILRESGQDGRSLGLEITESVIMENEESAISILQQLRARNFEIQIDDFGTGYSSLGCLRRLPADILKLDRSFVSGLGFGGGSCEFVSLVIALAHNLGMEVVAEGIETAGQLGQLRKLKCEYGQGEFFSTPVDLDQATAMIAAGEPAIKVAC